MKQLKRKAKMEEKMKCDYFEKQCNCEHTVEIELSPNVEFAKMSW